MKLDQATKDKLISLAKILEQLKFRYVVIGAMALLLQEVDLGRTTRDIDFTFMIDGGWDEFNRIKESFVKGGFQHTKIPHRMKSEDGFVIDLLPIGENILKKDSIYWPDGMVMNAIGLKFAINNSVKIRINKTSIPVAPIPIIVMLKIFAFNDHRDQKHIKDILCCFSDYERERRFDLLTEEIKDLTYENSGAYLVGTDLRKLISQKEVGLIKTAILEFESYLFFDELEEDIMKFFINGLSGK